MALRKSKHQAPNLKQIQSINVQIPKHSAAQKSGFGRFEHSSWQHSNLFVAWCLRFGALNKLRKLFIVRSFVPPGWRAEAIPARDDGDDRGRLDRISHRKERRPRKEAPTKSFGDDQKNKPLVMRRITKATWQYCFSILRGLSDLRGEKPGLGATIIEKTDQQTHSVELIALRAAFKTLECFSAYSRQSTGLFSKQSRGWGTDRGVRRRATR